MAEKFFEVVERSFQIIGYDPKTAANLLYTISYIPDELFEHFKDENSREIIR